MANSEGGKWYFITSNNNGVLYQVGHFGEALCCPLLNAEIFSGTDSPLTSADLFNSEEGMAVQVKMCNQKHAPRPRPQQVETLYQEVIKGFRVCYGIYAFVFYNGCSSLMNKGVRKQQSKIKSAKLSQIARAEIIAHELQYIYLMDIRLLRFIKRRHPKLLLRKNTLVKDGRAHKKDDHIGMYVKREFLRGFITGQPLQTKLLTQAFEFGDSEDTLGKIATRSVNVEFQGQERFEKKIPIFMIGRGDTVKAVLRQIQTACSLRIESDRQLALLPT